MPLDPTPEENRIVGLHYDRLKQATEAGDVFLSGLGTSGEFGIVIFEADSEEEARRFAESDPAVANGIMTAEFVPFRIALLRK
jgi:uncharacterized protein YciI